MRVYTMTGVPPETQAYAMAKYSRSAQSMLESVQDISAQKTAEFLNTFYFQYGHRSIADLAHVVMALEDISILAAMKVVDEPLWDGQERSTRYQNFRRSGYHVPTEIAGTPLGDRYVETADLLFSQYTSLSRQLLDLLVRVFPRPAEIHEKQYERTLRARAFDVARSLLPLATRTSVGQVTSARSLETQISRLLADPLAEIRAIGAAMKDACRRPAESPLHAQLVERLAGLKEALPADLATEVDAIAEALRPVPVAPTLVKYADPAAYPVETTRVFDAEARRLLAGLDPADPNQAVDLVVAESSFEAPGSAAIGERRVVDEIVATLLYRVDGAGHSYRQVLDVVRRLSDEEVRALLDRSLEHRGQHDDYLREHRAGYPLAFDVVMDLGAFRDLHRHRRCVQIIQPFGASLGYDDPRETFVRGLGEECGALAAEAGLVDRYRETLERAGEVVQQVDAERAGLGQYLLPMGYRCRALFKMDLAEAAYIAELRTKPEGHFSYRRIAYLMYEELRARYPSFGRHVRALDPAETFDLLDR